MRFRIVIIVTLIISMVIMNLMSLGSNDTLVQANGPNVKKFIGEKPVPLEPYHKNVIKLNPTPVLILENVRNITLSYERLIMRNQSFVIQAGYLLLPRIISGTVADLVAITAKEKYGINLAIEYRFYPFTRNRRPAPDGLYLTPFISYYGFQFKNHLDVLNSDVDQNGAIKGKLNVLNIGAGLGYQFIFWKRFSIDLLLFGPTVSHYSGSLDIAGDLDKEEIENIDKEFVEKLMNRFPILGQLFGGETLRFTGSRANWSFGFRYNIQLGFHF